jgi:hypothetical protein
MSALLAQSRVLTGNSWKKCAEHMTGSSFMAEVWQQLTILK